MTPFQQQIDVQTLANIQTQSIGHWTISKSPHTAVLCTERIPQHFWQNEKQRLCRKKEWNPSECVHQNAFSIDKNKHSRNSLIILQLAFLTIQPFHGETLGHANPICVLHKAKTLRVIHPRFVSHFRRRITLKKRVGMGTVSGDHQSVSE